MDGAPNLIPALGSQPAMAVPAQRYRGSVVYLFAYDIGYDMQRQAVPRLLGQPTDYYRLSLDKRVPRWALFYQPQMVRLPTQVRQVVSHAQGSVGRGVPVERWVKLFPVGALSIGYRLPFEDCTLEELVTYHDLRFTVGSIEADARALVEQARRELRDAIIQPVGQLRDEEAYTVFCLETPAQSSNTIGSDGDASAEAWLAANRRAVAALLTQEPDPRLLSEQETRETTSRHLSYYERDLVVVDWDAALVIDEPSHIDEALHIMELANVQLEELEAYDRLLDEVVERAYRELGPRRLRQSQRRRTTMMRELREIRIDLARLNDELSNTTKFFGDWHLARLYQGLSARFHLADWNRTIDEKLRTVDSVYQLLKQEQTNRWMMVLEATIVLLFIVDLIILVALGT